MSQILGMLSLGAAENLWDAKWSGWAYPPGRLSSLQLLENAEGTSGNEVFQEGPLTYRRGRLSFTAQGEAQRDLVRSYDEDRTEVSFVDKDGSTCAVLVDAFDPDWLFADLWHVDVALIQLTEPLPFAGSGSGE